MSVHRTPLIDLAPEPGKQILVVEDDRIVSTAIELLLLHYGYAVQVAPTLADARRLLAAAHHDALVLDLGMPDGTGLDLLEHIRATGRRLRVVVLTADVDPTHLRRLRDLRPERFLRKPMNFLDVLDGIRGEPPAVALATPTPVPSIAS